MAASIFQGLSRAFGGRRPERRDAEKENLSGPFPGVKLHLGCGSDLWPGYVNVDRDPASGADIVSDFLEIDRHFGPGSVAEVSMIHSLSYLNLWQARDLFAKFHRIVVGGGRIIIELPDIGKCADRLLASAGAPGDYLEAVRGIYAFDLGQISRREAYTPYAFGWTGWHLKEELEDAGFTNVALRAPQTHGHPWRDVRVEATKPLT
jgi:hypothetical protein